MAEPDFPTFKPVKAERGWMLEARGHGAVTDADGYAVRFTSRAKAMAAEIVWDADNVWWTIRPETL